MAFKMVTDSEKAAGRIAGTAVAHAGTIAEEQTARWRHRLPAGQQVVDLEQLQRYHAEELRRLREVLLEKEAAHLDRLAEVSAARERRDAAAPRLRERLYVTRDLVTALHGERGSRSLFLGKPVVPVDATPLRRVGRLVVDNLEDPDFELPDARFEGVDVTRSKVAGEIEEPLTAMEKAMQELEDLLPLAAASLEEKRQAHAAVDEKNGQLARFLEGLYGLAGHDVLAAKVRPSSHGRKEAEPAEAEESRESARVEDAGETTEAGPETAPEEARESVEPGSTASAMVTGPRPVVARKALAWSASEDTRVASRRESSPLPPTAGGASRRVSGPAEVGTQSSIGTVKSASRSSPRAASEGARAVDVPRSGIPLEDFLKDLPRPVGVAEARD